MSLTLLRCSTMSIGLLLVIVFLSGCESAQKKRPGVEGYNELIRSQQQALAIEQLKAPAVYFRGPFRNPVVAWRENLTLTEAMVEAVYLHTLSPRVLRLHRQGRLYNLDVQRLLRGTENPLLEPSDVIEVVR